MLALAAPLLSAQVSTTEMGCPRRLSFDLSTNNPSIGFEWTSATDPAGTVYLPNGDGSCTSGASSESPLGANRVSGPACPTNGVPYGMNATLQYDQADAIQYAGWAPFSPYQSGIVRIKNIATDSESTPPNRLVDLVLRVVPEASMNTYTSLLSMKFNSVVMPWNNDVPATQFRLTDGGFIALGYGLLPGMCTGSGDLLTTTVSTFCADAQGYGAEYTMDFVYADTFSYTSQEPVNPPLDQYYVVFWDIDGDTIDNSWGNDGSNYTDVAGNPAVPNVNGFFPQSIVNEELYEVQALKDANSLTFHGTAISEITDLTERVVRGTGPPTGNAGNVPTDFAANPYTQLAAAFSAQNQQAIAVYQTKDMTTGFRILLGGVSSVGRQYERPGAEFRRPYGLVPPSSASTVNSVTDVNGPYPKRQNDRGFLLSILYPEPYCTCDDACPAACADASTADANCARNPNCACPTVCQGANPPAVCGSHPTCPSVACPTECDYATSALADYYSYCRKNPMCACPAKCSGCATGAAVGSATCADDCSEFAACSSSPPAPTCAPPPSPPPFPPPLPPLPCMSWCNANTCDMKMCEGCSDCIAVSEGTYCASWCNAYTCDEDMCEGCSACATPASSSTCHSWCSAYTCFGSCTSCAVCSQVASNSYCASWCNAYTCGGMFSGLCGGCSECAAVTGGTYCASWCNSYTCDGIFESMCSGCSMC